MSDTSRWVNIALDAEQHKRDAAAKREQDILDAQALLKERGHGDEPDKSGWDRFRTAVGAVGGELLDTAVDTMKWGVAGGTHSAIESGSQIAEGTTSLIQHRKAEEIVDQNTKAPGLTAGPSTVADLAPSMVGDQTGATGAGGSVGGGPGATAPPQAETIDYDAVIEEKREELLQDAQHARDQIVALAEQYEPGTREHAMYMAEAESVAVDWLASFSQFEAMMLTEKRAQNDSIYARSIAEGRTGWGGSLNTQQRVELNAWADNHRAMAESSGLSQTALTMVDAGLYRFQETGDPGHIQSIPSKLMDPALAGAVSPEDFPILRQLIQQITADASQMNQAW